MKIKINYPILIVFSILSLGVNAQTIIDPWLIVNKYAQEKRIKNKVKKESIYIYEAEENGNLPEKGKLRSEITYNLQGKTLVSISYFPDMTIKNSYEYDQNGNTIKMTSYDGSNNIREILAWEYDEKGNQLRTKYYSPDGKLKSTKENNEKKEGNFNINYNTKGEISSKTEQLYDSIEKISIDRLLTPKGKLEYENKYYLNDKLRVKEWRVIDNVQNKKFIVKYIYDENGNEIESIKTDFKSNQIEKTTHKYDQNSLEIEKVIESQGKTKKVFKYQYEYF